MFLVAANESLDVEIGMLSNFFDKELWELMATILSGVIVYVLSQQYTEFILRPIQEYKRLKARVAKLLVLHAAYYSNPWIYGDKGDYSAWSVASAELRELAAEVAAFAEIKPWQIFVLGAIPRKKSLIEAYHYLIGLSNSLFTSKSREEGCIERVCDYPDIIRKSMGISYTKKKTKR